MNGLVSDIAIVNSLYIFAAQEHVFVIIIITSYDYKPLYQMHLIFFFNEGSLGKDVAFRVDMRIIIYIKILQRKLSKIS